jgi:hypothetical protein
MENLLKSIKLPEHQKEVENLTSIIGQLLLEEVGNTGLLVVENLVSNETLLSTTKLTTQSPIDLGNWVSDNVIIQSNNSDVRSQESIQTSELLFIFLHSSDNSCHELSRKKSDTFRQNFI